MSKHWTERSVKDFLHRITSDFITQLEKKMESLPLTQTQLAKKLKISEGRISQILNNPGNLTLIKIIEYSRALNLKVAIVAYENNDDENGNAPVNSEIFSICWERQGKPTNYFSLEQANNKMVGIPVSGWLASDITAPLVFDEGNTQSANIDSINVHQDYLFNLKLNTSASVGNFNGH